MTVTSSKPMCRFRWALFRRRLKISSMRWLKRAILWFIPRTGERLSFWRGVFEWEFATACAGWRLGINPFDQPNVQEAKDATKELLIRS